MTGDIHSSLSMQSDQQHPNNEVTSRLPSSEGRTKATFDLLPFELIAHVFILGCPRSRFEDTLFAPPEMEWPEDPLPYQLLVASVCRLWRHVALGTPKLWSSIFVNLSLIDNRSRITTPESLRLIEQRSAATDLFLYITASDWDGCSSGPVIDPTPDIVPIIVRMLPRVYTLAIDAFDAIQIEAIFPLVNLPRLRHLYFEQTFEFNPSTPEAIFDRTIHLESFHFYPERMPSLAEANCLERVATRSLTCGIQHVGNIHATLDTIERSIDLEHLHFIYQEDRFRDLPQRISHPTLSSLKLTTGELQPTLACLGTLPELVHLTIQASRDTYPPDTRGNNDPVPFISKFPKLKTLVATIYCGDGCEDFEEVYIRGIAPVMKASPALAAIELWDWNALEIVTFLAGQEANGATNPTLRHIRIVLDHPDAMEWLEPMALVCTRLLTCRPSIRIEWHIQPSFVWDPQDAARISVAVPHGVECFYNEDDDYSPLAPLEMEKNKFE